MKVGACFVGGLLHAIAALICATSLHGDYQAGVDAYEAGDYASAMTQWKAEINRPGEPENLAIYRETLYAIGMLYWQGKGVARDDTVAAVWLKQAADINHPEAQNKLGFMYSTGQGVPQNFEQARHWFELAAAQGDADAVHNLDVLLREQVAASGNPAGPESMPEPVPEPRTAAGVEWIRAQNAQHYTLQVIALRKPDNLHAFIARHADDGPYAIYRPAGAEQPLWVLLRGVYAGVAAARAAAAAFPEGIQQRDQLWIRQFGAVQRELE